jgi:hypothetical protein
VVDWVRLRLDVDAFDHAEFEPYLRRERESGIGFMTMAELGDTAGHRRALYTYDEYLARRVDVPTFDACGVVLAIVDNAWIGMPATSLHPAKGCAVVNSQSATLRPGLRIRSGDEKA